MKTHKPITKEKEGFGVDYERFAIIRLSKKVVKELGIGSVVEIPAGGVKAAPSLYSIGFGLEDCKVILINGEEYIRRYWKQLGIGGNVKFLKEKSIYQTTLPDNFADLVWNYVWISKCKKPLALIKEMKRISRRFVMCASINGFNMGFWIHRALHKITKIPWTHGNTMLNFPHNLKGLFKKASLKNIKMGVVDCPPWPDSLGFRDMRLHRRARALLVKEWDPQIITLIKEAKIPRWMQLCYLIGSLPIPTVTKLIHAHVFYIIGEK